MNMLILQYSILKQRFTGNRMTILQAYKNPLLKFYKLHNFKEPKQFNNFIVHMIGSLKSDNEKSEGEIKHTKLFFSTAFTYQKF